MPALFPLPLPAWRKLVDLKPTPPGLTGGLAKIKTWMSDALLLRIEVAAEKA